MFHESNGKFAQCFMTCFMKIMPNLGCFQLFAFVFTLNLQVIVSACSNHLLQLGQLPILVCAEHCHGNKMKLH